MRQNNEKKHTILKIVAVLVGAFLIFVAFNDFTPEQTDVEKTFVYEAK